MESLLTPADRVFLLPFIVALGLIFGSFVTALSYRLPRGLSIAHGRSKCPACGATLTARDLVPIASWLAHRGACRHCGSKISWRYPAVEAVMAVLFVAAALAINDPARLALILCATPILVALAVIDIEQRRLPNVLVVLLVPIALLWRFLGDGDFLTAVATGVLAFGFALVLDAIGRKIFREGLGGGDAKLLAIAGLALPLVPFLAFLLLAGAIGVITGAAWRVRHISSISFPFGPAILASFWTVLIAL